jgi:outer membrane protein TolC
MPLLRFISAALAVGFFAGCVTYQAKELIPATTQSQLESRTLQDGGLRRFLTAHAGAVADDRWDLSRLTLAAFYFSPELEIARTQLSAAQANLRVAAARANPSLNVTPGYNQAATGGVTPWILGYALDVPLELNRVRTHRTAEAQAQVEAARLSLAAAAWQTRTAVRRALTELHAAEGAARVWREQQPLLAAAAKIVDAQVRAGDVSPFEAASSRTALSRAELAAREADRAMALARSRLAEVVGVPLAALADVKISFAGLAEPVAPLAPIEVRRFAAQNRADLLAALADYAAAEFALRIEIGRQYPDLAFGPGYQLDQGEGKWSLSLGITLPLLHQNQGPIAAAAARREVAAAKFLALQHHVLAEVDRAASAYTSALGDLDAVNAMQANLARQAGALRAQKTAGEISPLELTRAQLELADAARAELDARSRVEQALTAFEDAVQRPLTWPEDAWRKSGPPASQ